MTTPDVYRMNAERDFGDVLGPAGDHVARPGPPEEQSSLVETSPSKR